MQDIGSLYPPNSYRFAVSEGNRSPIVGHFRSALSSGMATNLEKARGQAVGMEAITGFPYLKKGSLHLRGVDPRFSPAVEVLRLSSVSEKPDGELAVVTGEGHEFVQNQSFLLAARLKVLGCQDFQSWAILVWVVGSSFFR